MTTPVWPEGLPFAAAVDGWTQKPFREPLETDMDGGNVRVRRRPGDDVATLGWERLFGPADMATFRSFVGDTLLSGTRRFRMPVSLDGDGFDTRTVQIVGGSLGYSAPAPGIVRVKMELRVFPPAVVG